VAKRRSELLHFTSEIQLGLIPIPIDSDRVPDLYSIRGEEIGQGIDNKALNRQLQPPRVIVPFRGVHEQKFPGRIGYVKGEFSLGSFRYSLLQLIEFVLQNAIQVIPS
jgi:hypothetical protein